MTAQATLAMPRPSLFSEDGQWLTCPGCEREHLGWQYKRLKRNPHYRTAEVVKCPTCGHVFAPLPPCPQP